MIRKIVLFFIISIALTAPHSARADEEATKLAINCAAIFYVVTATPPEGLAELLDMSRDAISGLYQQMSQLGQMMGFMYGANRLGDGAERVTNGDIIQARDAELKRLASIYSLNSEKVENMYIRCNQWREILSEYFITHDEELSGTDNEIRRVLLNAPMPKKGLEVSPEEEMFAVALMAAGFESFALQGSVTATDMKKLLRKKLLGDDDKNISADIYGQLTSFAIPEGYCPLDRNNPQHKNLVEQFEETKSMIEKYIHFYTVVHNCDRLEDYLENPTLGINDYFIVAGDTQNQALQNGTVRIPKPDVYVTMIWDLVQDSGAKIGAESLKEVNDILSQHRKLEIKAVGVQQLPIRYDEECVYTLSQQRTEGAQAETNVITGMCMLGNRSITLYLYRPFSTETNRIKNDLSDLIKFRKTASW